MSYGKSPWTGSEIPLHGDFCSSILLGIKPHCFHAFFMIILRMITDRHLWKIHYRCLIENCQLVLFKEMAG